MAKLNLLMPPLEIQYAIAAEADAIEQSLEQLSERLSMSRALFFAVLEGMLAPEGSV